eukprot:CAMPEP_0198118244 /NCGR_PEP_ID=MMETSP1442-20131203/20873_1 /TAXON_ID= /ORGANISM="Craspedostauros australis, Strain CCMP3328" /LENGTH=249 /DNA_ID=CAMNT_0043776467 /DNA_START=68 /DNA_END=817 /DNA_ORIENTATION=-
MKNAIAVVAGAFVAASCLIGASDAFVAPAARRCPQPRSQLRPSAVVFSSKRHGFPSVLDTQLIPPFPNQRLAQLRMSADSSDTSGDDEEGGSTGDSFLTRWRKRLFPPQPDDGLSTRQRLAKLGLSVLLSYGCVSNFSSAIAVSCAWFTFNKQTATSPLAPGQWKGFLAVYAGFYVFTSFLRPLRVAAAVAIAPKFEVAVKSIQNRLNVNKQIAIGITVFAVNVVATTSLLSLGVVLASMASGVPIFVK